MKRTDLLPRLGFLLLAATANAFGGDIAATLDTTNGASSFVVYDATTAALFRVQSDGAIQATGSVTAAAFTGSGAGLTNLSGAAIAAGTISNVHLATGAVSSVNIAVGAVGALQIQNGSITALDLAKAYQSGVESLDVLIRTNSCDFAAFTTNWTVAFPFPFDAAPIVTLALATGTDYNWSPGLFLRQATPTNFTVRLDVPSISTHAADNGNYAAQYSSLALVNGNPAMAYRGGEISELDLYYVRASNANGTAWGSPVRVYTNNSISYCSLAVVDGAPAIGFYDSSSDDLLYVRATDTNGATWGSPVTVLTNGNIGQHVSLAVIDGNPAMSSFYSTSNDLLYVRASDSQGTAWGAPVTVATNMHTYGSCLLTVNGNPAIAYTAQDSLLMYARAADQWGNTWDAPVTAAGTNHGWYAAMAIVQTNPAIAFHDPAEDDLRYVRASNINGTAWAAPVNVDTNGTAGVYPALAVISNNPAIAHWEADEDVLKFERASNASGSSWATTPVTVYSTDGVDGVAGLLEIDGSAAIGFVSTDDLQYIQSGSVPPGARLNWVAVEP